MVILRARRAIEKDTEILTRYWHKEKDARQNIFECQCCACTNHTTTTTTTQTEIADSSTTEDLAPGLDNTHGEIQGLEITSIPHHRGSQDDSARAVEDYPESEMDNMDWNDLEQIPLKGTIIRIKQGEKTPSLPQKTSLHSGLDTRQRNSEGQQDTSTNHKWEVFPNLTEGIKNIATDTTDRTMQPSETPWINGDPHFITTPHYRHEEERRSTEDDFSDWELDNLDWEVLEHPPHEVLLPTTSAIAHHLSVLRVNRDKHICFCAQQTDGVKTHCLASRENPGLSRTMDSEAEMPSLSRTRTSPEGKSLQSSERQHQYGLKTTSASSNVLRKSKMRVEVMGKNASST